MQHVTCVNANFHLDARIAILEVGEEEEKQEDPIPDNVWKAKRRGQRGKGRKEGRREERGKELKAKIPN